MVLSSVQQKPPSNRAKVESVCVSLLFHLFVIEKGRAGVYSNENVFYCHGNLKDVRVLSGKKIIHNP